jgi:hypothetical protein
MGFEVVGCGQGGGEKAGYRQSTIHKEGRALTPSATPAFICVFAIAIDLAGINV